MNRSRSLSLSRSLDPVHLGPCQSVKSLHVWPLLRRRDAPDPETLRSVTLARALEDGFVSLEPLPGGAGISSVRVQNRAPDPVLVLFGETLRCGREPLGANATVLVPARDELVIDVHLTGPAGDPPELGRALRCLDDQVGFVASVGDAVVGAELLGDPAHLRDAFATLLRAYVPASDEPGPAPLLEPMFDAPEPFLAALARGFVVGAPTPGLGDDFRILGAGVAGCALAAGGLVHLTAFPDPMG